MPLPNFLIIGAQKAGTSWLAAMLRQHPEVFLAGTEIHYFDKGFNHRRGCGWYAEHFAAAGSRPAIGEKTPDYLWAGGQGAEDHLPEVHRNLHRLLPEARLIVILRNPVERAVSALTHLIRTGRVSPLYSFDDLLLGRRRHLVEGHGVIDKGRYHRQLRAYLDLFDASRILALTFEQDVLQRPQETAKRVCRFLGIDDGFAFAGLRDKRNATRYSWPRLVADYYLRWPRSPSRHFDRLFPVWKPRPSPPVLRDLYALFAEENRNLCAMLGWSAPFWEAPAVAETATRLSVFSLLGVLSPLSLDALMDIGSSLLESL